MALLPHFLSFRQVGIDWYPQCKLVRDVPTYANQAENPAGSWHFARPQLAQRYLQTFQIGLVSAQALFAPRRMGKSEFLEQDLIPAAQKSGLLTAYLNLWDAREHPRGALISALARAGSPRGLSALIKKLKTPLKKVKASAKLSGIAECSLEAELTEDPRIAGPALSELLRSFDRADRTLLLVLDEAQVLASPVHSDLAHSLRAGLDIRKQTIKVIFAGSSESSLRRMFGRATEPFYNWAPIEPFERLGAEFVIAMTHKVNQLSRYPLSASEALHAFEALKRTPEFFRRYLQRYLAHAELGPRAALDDTFAQVFNDSGYRTAWGRLLPADKAVLRALAQGVNDLHSLPARNRLGEELGLGKAAPLDTPKNALRRLQKDELVVKLEYGHYQIQDEGFIEWLRQLELEE
jgi:hypothetical protein